MKKLLFFLLAIVGTCISSTPLFSQETRNWVSGIVTDENNIEIPNASLLTGSPLRSITMTDAKGAFRINIPAGSTLIVRSVGFLEYKTTIRADQNTLTIQLKEEQNTIGEVVVRGYATRTRELSTGSSTVVSGEMIQDRPTANIEGLLQGMVPGFNVQVNTGAPGFRGTTQIRGLSSMSVSGSGSESFLQPTSPLYVIDGVPLDADRASEFGFDQQGPGVSPLSMIPQEDVASIEILKDAQATSMYGSRAAYGVIIITTKRGNSEIPRVRYTHNTFMQTPPKLRETLGGHLERQLKIRQILDNALTEQQIRDIANSDFLSDSLNSYYNNSTNWQSVFFRTTYNQTHNLAIDGGNQQFNYKANLGYFSEKGIIRNTGFDRYNLNLGMEYNPNPKLRFRGNIFGSLGRQNKGEGVGLLQTGVARNGMSSTLLPGPSFFQASGDVVAALRTNNDNNTRNIRTNAEVNYELIPGLRAVSFVSYEFISDIEDTFTPAAANNQFARVYAFQGRDFTLNNRNSIQYSKTFGDRHNLFVNALNEIYVIGRQNSASRQERTPNDQFQGPLGFDGILSRGGGVLTNFKDERIASFAASVSYDFERRYVVDLSYRLDGSSLNGMENLYSRNPAVGFRWNINHEPFTDNWRWLDYGSVRLSWGMNIMPEGRLEDIYGRYDIRGNYNNQQGIGINFGRIPNPSLKPKTSLQYNLGIDFAIFQNKVEVIYDTYYKHVDNMLFPLSLSNTTGFNELLSNDAGIVNYGHELALTFRPLPQTSKFNWMFTINGAVNHDVLMRLPSEFNGQYIRWDDDQDYLQHNVFRVGTNTLSNYLRINEGVYSYDHDVPVDPVTGLRYQADGRFFEAGDPMFKDTNGDFILDLNDYEINGNSQPLITGGLSTTLSYQGISLSVFASYTARRTILNNALADRMSLMRNPFGSGDNNRAVVPLDDIDMWLRPGDIARYPYAYDFTRYDQIRPFRPDQTLWAEDGSYLKLNSIVLGYMLPKRTVTQIGLNNLRFYVSTENLHTFSRYTGPNPENVTNMGRDASGGYPVPRRYTIGLNVEF